MSFTGSDDKPYTAYVIRADKAKPITVMCPPTIGPKAFQAWVEQQARLYWIGNLKGWDVPDDALITVSRPALGAPKYAFLCGAFRKETVVELAVPDKAEPQSTDALRYNDGKIDLTLLPVDALEAEAEVWMAGEKKYGRSNWEKLWGVRTRIVAAASLYRHLLAILRGEDIDPETGKLHAAHIRCNAAMLIRHYNETKGQKS